DGVLLLTMRGECLHTNQQGRRLCRLLGADAAVPTAIWSVCERLIDSRSWLSEYSVVLSETVLGQEGSSISIRVQWFELDSQPEPSILVTLENKTQAAKVSALVESRQYKLTPKETEVWVLRKINYSYEEIAAQLFIALNTVKRHIKSINAKRKQVMEEMEA
ncbi:MAG TPA: LuxR C-terminal-related transcriptional regulator, partial [Trichocoleus sp.]